MTLFAKKPALASAILFLLISLGGSVLFVVARDGFGASDLYPMAGWSSGGALVLAATASGLFRRSRNWNGATIYLASALAAILFAAGLSAVMFLVLGMWMAAFSFPVPFLWLGASLVGLVVPVFADRGGRLTAVGSIAIPFLVLLAVARSATTAPPDILLIAKKDLSSADVQRIWTEVLATPSPSGTGFALLPGIGSISAFDGANEKRLRVGFQPGTNSTRRDEIVRQVRTSSLVERVDDVDPKRHDIIENDR
jgi:hypothetical protein